MKRLERGRSRVVRPVPGARRDVRATVPCLSRVGAAVVRTCLYRLGRQLFLALPIIIRAEQSAS